MVIEFTVETKPLALKRPRFYRGRCYNPSKVDMDMFLDLSKPFAPPRPLTGGLYIELEFRFKHPKSHFTKDHNLRTPTPIHHTQVPDVDNLIKFVLDALNRVFYEDDKQVVKIKAIKKWSIKNEIYMKIDSI